MEEQQTPLATLSLNEISALSIILQFYERHLWMTTMPSAKRSQRSLEITAVTVKLLLLQQGDPATLTEQDLAYVQAALRMFISEVKKKILLSDNRTSLLASCQQLQILFSNLIPKEATDKGE